MRMAALLTIGLCLVTAAAFGQASREFNWLPSGSINVGNLESENDSSYRSVGEIIESHRAYSDGVRPSPKGRRTTEETFAITIARWRAGPATGALVIRRRIDTAAEPGKNDIDVGADVLGAPPQGGDLQLRSLQKPPQPGRHVASLPCHPQIAGRAQDDANIDLDLGSTVIDSVTIRYFSTDDAPANPSGQLLGITDMSWTPVPDPGTGLLVTLGLMAMATGRRTRRS